MDILIHQGGQVFLKLKPELADGSPVDFKGALTENDADPSICRVVQSPNDPSVIAVQSVADNVGSDQVTVTYTNPDGATATLLLNVTVAPADATRLEAEASTEVPVGTAFPPGPTPPPAAPTITGLSPNTGAVASGSFVASGTGLTGASAGKLGTTDVTVTATSDTSANVTYSNLPGPGVFDLSITTPAGTATLTGAFTAN